MRGFGYAFGYVYGQGLVYVAIGGAIGVALKRNVFEKEPRTSLLFDTVDLCATVVFWPVFIPLQTALYVDVLLNDATWTFTRETKMSTLVLGNKIKEND